MKLSEAIKLLFFGLIVFSVVFPLVWMLLTSLKPAHEVISNPPIIFPKEITFDNYCNVFSKTSLPKQALNSFFVGVLVTLITTSISLLGAYSLTRIHVASSKIISRLPLITYAVAPIMLVIPLALIFKKVSLNNTYFSLVTAQIAYILPFNFIMLSAFMQSIPLELDRSATIDGASKMRILFLIIVPNIIPGIIVVAIFTFIFSWNDFLFSKVLITSESLKTIPTGLDDLLNASKKDWALLMSASLLSTLPIAILFLVVQNKLKATVFSGIKI